MLNGAALELAEASNADGDSLFVAIKLAIKTHKDAN